MDEKIDRMIKEILRHRDTSLQSINQVLITVKNSLNRLNATEKFCCDQISRLFGKDIRDCITGMMSHYDGSESAAGQAMAEAKIEFTSEFKFNNGSNFVSQFKENGEIILDYMGEYHKTKNEFKAFNAQMKAKVS